MVAIIHQHHSHSLNHSHNRNRNIHNHNIHNRNILNMIPTINIPTIHQITIHLNHNRSLNQSLNLNHNQVPTMEMPMTMVSTMKNKKSPKLKQQQLQDHTIHQHRLQRTTLMEAKMTLNIQKTTLKTSNISSIQSLAVATVNQAT
jgi:hypothetical protein